MGKIPKEDYLTVSALTRYIKRKFEVDPYLQRVWVVGELSNFRLRPNSHQYFSLKDDQARISAVMYRPAFAKVPFQLEEGMKVIACGRVTLYEPSGSYQLIIESMEPDGVGALYLALEQLKQKFKAAGLLDLPKKPIPLFPQKIAVITSPSGAVIRDILTTIKRRYPIVQVTVFPTRVQGKEAKMEIVNAFQQVAQLKDQYDTLILARGGGSIEDLWCFNEEEVAQAILSCSLPVITAIGHETDTTLSDLVADMRAPTPTAAAELAVPVLQDLRTYIEERRVYLYRLMQQQLQLAQKHLGQLTNTYVLRQPERLYQAYYQQLDRLMDKFSLIQQTYFVTRSQQIAWINQRLLGVSPQQQISTLDKMRHQYTQRLEQAMQQFLKNQHLTLSKQVGILEAYSPLNIMSRGYALIECEEKVVKRVSQLQVADQIQVNLYDGQLIAEVKAIQHKES